MARYDTCTCGNRKLSSAKQCGTCYHLARTAASPIDLQCDGSGTMRYLCDTLLPHLHCRCGEPMLVEMEIARGFCDRYCLAERMQRLHFPEIQRSHGAPAEHILTSQKQSSFKEQEMAFNHGTEMLSFREENELKWAAKEREERSA